MSRMVRAWVSGSLSQTTRRMVTFNGTAKVMPRSWHSSTSYLSLSPTGSSHVSQLTARFSFTCPHFGQWISLRPRRPPRGGGVLARGAGGWYGGGGAPKDRAGPAQLVQADQASALAFPVADR